MVAWLSRCAAFGVSQALILIFFMLSPASAETVDVELVLAVDTSSSMKAAELVMQRQGYAAAFRSPEVIKAITGSGTGRIAVTYVEWGASTTRQVIVPWTLVSSAEDAFGVADMLEQAKQRNLFQTSISGAIRYGLRAFQQNGFSGAQRVIDISGDGPNNQGGPVTTDRDIAIIEGVTINGLPLMMHPDVSDGEKRVSLDAYYTDCVIGGPASFILPVRSWEQFPEAIRRKLLLELTAGAGGSFVWRAGASGMSAAVTAAGGTTDCTIGEKLWRGMEVD